MPDLLSNTTDEHMHNEAELSAYIVDNLNEEELLNFISYLDDHEYIDIINQ